MPFPDSEYPSITRGKEKRESQRLLAAAPELLAALKAWMYLESGGGKAMPCYCEDLEVTPVGKCYACLATAAIAKAEGRE